MSDISLRMDLLNANIEIVNLTKRIAELENPWISVKDGPPENRTGVIASNTERVGEVYYDKDRFQHAYDCQYDEWDAYFISTITHWMPKPALPKGQNNG